jgi:hypothetical protein
MNKTKAKAIRRAMKDVKSEGEGFYESILHPFTLPHDGGGTYSGAMETLRCKGPRRAYQLGKKIYKRFKVMPKRAK